MKHKFPNLLVFLPAIEMDLMSNKIFLYKELSCLLNVITFFLHCSTVPENFYSENISSTSMRKNIETACIHSFHFPRILRFLVFRVFLVEESN